MQMILLGAPGAGKGTQAQFIVAQYNLAHIATGDMLRTAIKANSELGIKAKKIMDAGELVPDQVIIDLVKERTKHADCQHGFLLDGFPRTISQAKATKAEGIATDFVLELCVDDEQIIDRIKGRRIHASSGRVYHTVYKPPQTADKDDLTGEPLIIRPDDTEITARKRLSIYHQQTKPLIAYYKQAAAQGQTKYIKIDGRKPIAIINQQIKYELNK